MEGKEVEGEGWKVRGWRVRGYEVVRIERLLMLKITHTIFALMRHYSSLAVSLPCSHLHLVTCCCCHSNPSTAEGEEDGDLTNDCDPDQLITRMLEVEGDPVATLL